MTTNEKWAWEQTSGGAGWWLTENTEARLYMTRNAAPTEAERDRIGMILNAHDELVAALEELTSDAMLSTELPFAAAVAFHDARALLARIKGESNE